MITRQQHTQITREIQSALADVFEQHGLVLRTKSGKYGPAYVLTIEGIPAADDGDTVNKNAPEALAYTEAAAFYGLPADGLGREFIVNGDTFVITGLNERAPKMPVQGTRVSDGKRFKFSPGTVIGGLAANGGS